MGDFTALANKAASSGSGPTVGETRRQQQQQQELLTRLLEALANPPAASGHADHIARAPGPTSHCAASRPQRDYLSENLRRQQEARAKAGRKARGQLQSNMLTRGRCTGNGPDRGACNQGVF